MSVEKHALANGATILLDHNPNTDIASLGYFFRVGSRYETAQENGLAHFLEHMAFKGTHNRSARELDIQMDDLGARANAFTSKEATCYYMTGAADDIHTSNDLLSDISFNLSLPADELERERGAIVEEIYRKMDNAQGTVVEKMFATAYPEQAYGATTLGPKSNVENFNRAAFEKFREKHYHAGNLIVSAAGNFDPARILADIESKISGLPQKNRSRKKKALYGGGEGVVIRPADKQVHIFLGFESTAAGHKKDNAAEAVMNAVLSSGMSSRLFHEVRGKRGLVYTVSSGLNRSADTGLFYCYAGTSPEKVETLMPVLSDELDKMRQSHITDEEMTRAIKKLMVSHAAGQEESESRMVSNANSFNLLSKITPRDALQERLQAVTKDQVMDAAQRILAGAPTLVSSGPSGHPSLDQLTL